MSTNDNIITAFGQSLTPEQWATKPYVRIPPEEIVRRIEMGMNVDQALTDPMDKGPRKSRYRGVAWHVKNQKWVAQIRVNNKVEFLGQFACDKDAAQAYNARAASLGKRQNAL